MRAIGRRSTAFSAALGLGALTGLAARAGAATSGPSMPWDGPLQTILQSLSGTVAHVLITVAVIVTGLVFAFTEHGSGARRLFGVAFGGALALGALSFMTAVGWAGATF
jgi:type IV secretion system protein TrbC